MFADVCVSVCVCCCCLPRFAHMIAVNADRTEHKCTHDECAFLWSGSALFPPAVACVNSGDYAIDCP